MDRPIGWRHSEWAAAQVLASTPPGGWPETQQALRQFRDVSGRRTKTAIRAVARAGGYIHPDRR